MDKLPMKFSALNVDFDGPSLDFLGSRKPAHENLKIFHGGQVIVNFVQKFVAMATGVGTGKKFNDTIG